MNVIFGASTVGKFVLDICEEKEIKIHYFCDNNPDKMGTIFHEIPVISLQEIKEKDLYRSDPLLFFISVVDIQDIVSQLEKEGLKRWISCANMLSHIYHPLIYNMILSHDNYMNKDKTYLRGVDIVITERCSLKCKDCSNLMNYYEKPVDYSPTTVYDGVNQLLSLVDKVGEARIIGGEPFMNKFLGEIVEYLIKQDKVDSVVIYTNATILPTKKQIEIFKNKKVIFYVSNYGKLSRKYDQLIELLNKEDINYIIANFKWTDCSKINQNNRSKKDNQKIFDDCCVKNLTTLIGDILYRCPFFANADQLEAIPIFYDGCVDLNNVTKGEIKKFLLKTKYLSVCDFCNGRSFNDPEIKANVQIKKPLEYKHYE